MSANDCKLCRVCKQEKPLSEFYKRHNGNPYNMCIQCHRDYGNKSYHEKGFADRHTAVNKSEILVINQLRANHIPAVPGKTLGYKWADVAAWGCVLIECKYSALKDGVFTWSFSAIQQKHGLRAHLVVLCADYGSEITYHVFDTKHPVFAHEDGKRKSGVFYSVNAKHHKTGKTALTKQLMDYYQDAWSLIEPCRLQVATQLDDDMFLSDWRVK